MLSLLVRGRVSIGVRVSVGVRIRVRGLVLVLARAFLKNIGPGVF